MMGRPRTQHDLFSYRINLDHRVRVDHPLRKIAAALDFSFVREEVAGFYGNSGHESVDPVILMKMMFLLFYDDVASERELMKIIAERLDYLWFLGYGLDETIPNHSVLSKARARWGEEVFESLFVRTVQQCVEAGLVDGKKIHLDSVLVDADASNDSIQRGGPELVAALRRAYRVQRGKFDEEPASASSLADPTAKPPKPGEPRTNTTFVSSTDPDTGVVRSRLGGARARYKHHRAVDDAHGVITSVETTAGDIDEGSRLSELVAQHQTNTGQAAATVVADSKYGTIENYVACQAAGMVTHMADLAAKQRGTGRQEGIFSEDQFSYDPQSDTYRCPSGQTLKARRLHPKRRTMEYKAPGQVCAQCPLRTRCTRSQSGRTLHRHEQHDVLAKARAQAASPAARRDRRRRKHVMEGSFADGANNHHLKRARWRRLHRQSVQQHLIAACQNLRLLLARARRPQGTAASARLDGSWSLLFESHYHLAAPIAHV